MGVYSSFCWLACALLAQGNEGEGSPNLLTPFDSLVQPGKPTACGEPVQNPLKWCYLLYVFARFFQGRDVGVPLSMLISTKADDPVMVPLLLML